VHCHQMESGRCTKEADSSSYAKRAELPIKRIRWTFAHLPGADHVRRRLDLAHFSHPTEDSEASEGARLPGAYHGLDVGFHQRMYKSERICTQRFQGGAELSEARDSGCK